MPQQDDGNFPNTEDDPNIVPISTASVPQVLSSRIGASRAAAPTSQSISAESPVFHKKKPRSSNTSSARIMSPSRGLSPTRGHSPSKRMSPSRAVPATTSRPPPPHTQSKKEKDVLGPQTEAALRYESEQADPNASYIMEIKNYLKNITKSADRLLHSKFNASKTDDTVWHDGILAFYEVFKYLENNMSMKLLPSELRRRQAFEKDLAYFYGSNWKAKYIPRAEVTDYLSHLEGVRLKGEAFLFAYAFPMYMTLMSTGQKLQKERMMRKKIWMGQAQSTAVNPEIVQIVDSPEGCAITHFIYDVVSLRNKFRSIFNVLYRNLDAEAREDFKKETQNAYKMNMKILKSVRGEKSNSISNTTIAVALTVFVLTLAVIKTNRVGTF